MNTHEPSPLSMTGSAPTGLDALDAKRYRWLRDKTTCNVNQQFMLPQIDRARGSNLLRGSVAEHLDAAIDAALRGSTKELG